MCEKWKIANTVVTVHVCVHRLGITELQWCTGKTREKRARSCLYWLVKKKDLPCTIAAYEWLKDLF